MSSEAPATHSVAPSRVPAALWAPSRVNGEASRRGQGGPGAVTRRGSPARCFRCTPQSVPGRSHVAVALEARVPDRVLVHMGLRIAGYEWVFRVGSDPPCQ
jgi:hypothetical protein